ncbi:DUF3800 domain-containing protein [Rubellimicrobium mesophilum]|uniref:DUF3800 domain-containing protein n=1 Tax=Rubellimicrobium mesophilum TaxID=1123067 RepID=UPI0009E7F578|nr:DUF3800 domain-containing protein [Rubellimicrobium mesophilum]
MSAPTLPLDGFAALMASYTSAVKQRKLVAVLNAYVDDSAKHLGRQMFFFGGYVNHADKWQEFTEEWARVLSENRSLPYTKMKNANSLHGLYHGWSEEDRDRKLKALASVIANSGAQSFHVSVYRKEFEQIFDKSLPYGFQKPHFICFGALITGITKLHRELGSPYPIRFIFDNQDEIRGSVLALYEGWKKDQPEDLRLLMGGTPTFENDETVLPLQAADMLAWHVQKEADEVGITHKTDISKLLFSPLTT